MLSDNLEGGGFWTFQSKYDIDKHMRDIKTKMAELYLPYLDQISNLDNAVSMVLDRSYDNFRNEYHRLIFLFAYVGAYDTGEIISRIVESFDITRKSKNQQIPYDKQQLNLLKMGVPEIEIIDEQ